MSIIGYINLGNYKVYTSEEVDGYGLMTVQDAISCFIHFSKGRKFNNGLEWCCGPGYFGLAALHNNLVKNMTFSDISIHAEDIFKRTINENNLNCKFYLSDNFKSIPKQRFDLIIGNPPHFNFTKPAWQLNGNVTEHDQRKMQDLDWKIHIDFFNNVNDYLTDDGKIMLMENVTGSKPDTFSKMLKQNNLFISNFSNSIEHHGVVYYIEISKII